MRKIEESMRNAIKGRKNWSSGNTSVTQYENGLPSSENYEHRAVVSLFGHIIAEVDYLCYLNVHVNLKTWYEYPTRTTQSRLSALGIAMSTRKGETYMNDFVLGYHHRFETYYPPFRLRELAQLTQPTPTLSIFDEQRYA